VHGVLLRTTSYPLFGSSTLVLRHPPFRLFRQKWSSRPHRAGLSRPAARSNNIHRCTIYEWLRSDPQFRYAQRWAANEYHETVNDARHDLVRTSFDILRSLIEDPATPAALRAKLALTILDHPRFNNLKDQTAVQIAPETASDPVSAEPPDTFRQFWPVLRLPASNPKIAPVAPFPTPKPAEPATAKTKSRSKLQCFSSVRASRAVSGGVPCLRLVGRHSACRTIPPAFPTAGC